MPPLVPAGEPAAPAAAAPPPESLTLELASEAATLALGEALGRLLAPGGVVLLVGDLGAGKTVLARGLARGLGVDPGYAVVSPTFTLVNLYPGRYPFYHADLYRLPEDRDLAADLLDEAADGVLAVEWAERAGGAWPPAALRLRLTVTGRQTRRASLAGPAEILTPLARAWSARGEGEGACP
ncbi:MAG: tRNA (adenosine(37)-N6)-threonylcarbamoyltransferase complex ATPase subunit type 1 TsaE [Deltaproteobacteria bacterium]|nr:tRNA (adenosine(37)-N6)-threonylcarbamoyltransferase complex ATPase subunit type 1 TsaE [Deltaproteobacteria bacterium]